MLSNPNTVNQQEIESNQLREAFLREYEENCNVYRTCRLLGISRSLIYNEWLHDPVFLERFKAIQSDHLDCTEGNVMFRAVHDQKSGLMAQMFVLNNLRRDKYGRDGDIQININHNHRLADSAVNLLSNLNIADISKVEYDAQQPAQLLPAQDEG